MAKLVIFNLVIVRVIVLLLFAFIQNARGFKVGFNRFLNEIILYFNWGADFNLDY